MKKFLLFTVGFFAGMAYIGLSFGGAFLLSAWLASHGLSNKQPVILLAFLCFIAVVGFYLLSRLFSKTFHVDKSAFPIGAFLTGDGVLLSIPLLNVLEPKRLVEIAGGNKALAQNYANLILVLIVGITCLVISWLVWVLFGQFRRFREMSMQLERQNAQFAMGAMPSAQPESQTGEGDSNSEQNHQERNV